MAEIDDKSNDRPPEVDLAAVRKTSEAESQGTPKLQSKKISISDFTIIKGLGKGSYGEVVLAKSKQDK